MQRLDDHDLDVIAQVRKFGERFDHPFLECSPLNRLRARAWNPSSYMLHISLQSG